MSNPFKQRLITALWGGKPDRVPLFDFLFSQKLYEEILGRKPEVYNAEDAVDLSFALGFDGVFIPFGGYAGFEAEHIAESTYKDEWGTIYKIDRNASWPIDSPIDFSVKNREDWKNYSFPDPHLPGRDTDIKIAIKKSERQLAIMGGALGPFTAAWAILGLENICILFYEDASLVKEVLTKCTEFYVNAGKIMVEAGADVLIIADDLGFKNMPFFSQVQFREFILPFFEYQVSEYRKLGVPVLMHNDGNIELFLDDLVKTGINGYHPVEREAGMDIALVRKSYGPKLCLIGNINNKTTLVFGTPEDVETEAVECLLIAGIEGGYVMSSDHSLHPDIPLKNIYAMIESAEKYGWYPLDVEFLNNFLKKRKGGK